MKKPLKNILILVLLVCILIVNQGCSSYSDLSISKEEFKMVNEYIKELGLEIISLKDAISIEHTNSLFENEQTKEKQYIWQLIVDYIENEQSEEPVNLNYSITFSKGSFSFDSNSDCDWVNIGG